MVKLKTDSNLTYRRIVAKFGTSLLTAGTNRLNIERMTDLVQQIAQPPQSGRGSGHCDFRRHRCRPRASRFD